MRSSMTSEGRKAPAKGVNIHKKDNRLGPFSFAGKMPCKC